MAAKRFVLITGASGGIGLALVEGFLLAGYQVIAVDVVESSFAFHEDVIFIKADLLDVCREEAAAQKFFSRIEAHVKENGLSVLVNNAAVQTVSSIVGFTRNEWRRTMDVNVMAPFIMVQGLLGFLVAANGSVINISSIHARLTKPNFVAYATSKAALSGMTRAMAVELGSQVRVVAIEPAAIETNMLKEGFSEHPESLRELNEYHPVGRIGRPDEIASLAVLLASPGTPFINGTIMEIDGGIGARLHDPD